ncbi:hypothetical protein [Streptomyces sp. SID3343]|uniref:hypothetical protein n=1 Tax=Streptomyces sp. SID3343 TaxID=2690260 RepID=UPI00136D47AA|nr:hypothetical protein [Streptomyces sp. SID3343]MYW05874.1 hypothetical protein [Streptomyces sp. SID3343]
MNEFLGPEARQLWLVVGVLIVVVRAPLGALLRGSAYPEPIRFHADGCIVMRPARGKGGGR